MNIKSISATFLVAATLISHHAFGSNGPQLNAKQAILIDTTTGKVLFEKNAHERVPPSSMSKILTVYLILEEIKAGRLKLDDTYLVSEKAWRKGGSKMFVQIGDRVKIEDLLRGVIVQSGNDASITLAEGLSGSEEAFAEIMTRIAHELGAKDSTFMNATGWPDPEHLTTVSDLALIAQKMIERFPEFYQLYAEREFTYNNIRQMNRNPLLYTMSEVDGLKTGHTDAGGYGLVASGIVNGRRLIMVINGTKSMKERAQDSKALMTWGYSYFASPKLFSAKETVDVADVWLGQAPKVDLLIDRDLHVTLPRHELKNLQVSVEFESPVAAPIKEGQRLGALVVSAPGIERMEIPLKASKDVEKAGFFARIKAAVHYLFFGHN